MFHANPQNKDHVKECQNANNMIYRQILLYAKQIENDEKPNPVDLFNEIGKIHSKAKQSILMVSISCSCRV